MKVFFTTSQRSRAEFDANLRAIYNYIEDFGYKNLDDRLFKISSEDFYAMLKKEGKDKLFKLFSQNIKYIQEADINVFECSVQSFSVGYMVQKSVELNKPTIVLYTLDRVPYFLMGVDEEKLIIKEYTMNNLEQTLKEALESARHYSDKRFNFFISPSLLSFLNEVSRHQNMTKSAFIRNLILEHKRKNARQE